LACFESLTVGLRVLVQSWSFYVVLVSRWCDLMERGGEI
jgi:hypothetical protein